MSVKSHAIVTGGASGIGLAVVRRFLARGAAVTVLDIDGEQLEALGAVGVEGHQVDVADAAAVEAAMSAAASGPAGPPDRLVACAGTVGQRVTALEMDDGGWRRLLDVHLHGTWNACRGFAKVRRDGETAIVTISSIVAANGFTLSLDYGTAKAAIEYLTKVLAVEWAPLGIRVNSVAPGYTATPMVKAMTDDGFDLSPVERRTPMGRLAEPEETAVAVEFLCFEAGFVTGTVLPVDGGWTAVGR